MSRQVTKPGPTGAELYTAVKDAEARGITRMELAREIGMSWSLLNTRYTTYVKKMDAHEYPFNFGFGTPWELKGDWIIVGDVHLPMTDLDFAMLPALIAEKHLTKPRNLLIAGDLFNMDKFSSYSQVTMLPDWQVERIAAKKMIDCWLGTFDRIHMLMGNHERRLQRWTMGQFDSDDIVSLIRVPPSKVKMSGFGYCTLNCKNTGSWRITHPHNYAQREGTVVNKLAQKFRQNIIGFHEHHTGIAWDDSGKNIIVNVGGLVDGEKFPYVSLDDNTKPAMKKSFLMMKGGYPYLFGEEPLTDWSFWL